MALRVEICLSKCSSCVKLWPQYVQKTMFTIVSVSCEVLFSTAWSNGPEDHGSRKASVLIRHEAGAVQSCMRWAVQTLNF
jgi:hypothetical protein